MAEQKLVEKLVAVMREVDHLEKRGHNAHHNYDYLTESDVVEAIRKHLARLGVLMTPVVDKIQLDKTEKGMMATVEISYTFSDGIEKITARTAGSGYDIPGDKAVYKAMTGALKYALRQQFLIPTGDDPERDEKDHDADQGPTDVGVRPSRESPAAPGPGKATRSNSSGSGSSEPTVRFGKNKGQKLADVDEAGLSWWTKVCEENVAKNDPKWHKGNVKDLEACEAEWRKRQPWRERWAMILEIGQNHGLDEDGVTVVLKENLGIASADKLADTDVERFRDTVAQQ